MTKPIRAIALSMAVLAVAGCTQSPTLGTLMAAEGRDIAAIGDKWTEGDKLITRGTGEIERGNRMLTEWRQLIRDGEANVSRGNRLQAEAKTEYRSRTGRELPVPE